MASDLLLTPKERARVNEVKRILAEGGNPYQSLFVPQLKKDTLDFESVIESKAATEVRVARELAKVAKLEARWKAGVEGKEIKVSKVTLDNVDMGGPITDLPPGMLKCSYCGNEVDQVNATLGKGRLRKIIKEEIYKDSSGRLHWEQETKHSTSKLVSCPDCVLNIKDTKFNDMEG